MPELVLLASANAGAAAVIRVIAGPHSTRVSHGLEVTMPIPIRARASTVGGPVPPASA